MDCTEKESVKPKREIKDSVFKDLFSEPQYSLELYQALHPEDTSVTTSDIKNVTITNVLVDAQYNDLSMLVKDKLLILLEAQSTWSVNIVVRMFLYLARLWHEHIEETNQDRYSSRRLKLPIPDLYVLYTGNRKNRPDQINLADEFFGGNDELINMTVNILYGTNSDDILGQYTAFTKACDDQVAIYGRTLKAIQETIRFCKNKDILTDYLAKREKEVITIMYSLFDQEAIMREHDNALRHEIMQEGIQEGIQKGKQEAYRQAALNMSAKGMGIAEITEILGVPTDTVKDWLSTKATS